MDLPNRKRIRLKNHDYAANGTYFCTICSYNKENIFGVISAVPVGQGLCSCRSKDSSNVLINHEQNRCALTFIGKIIDEEIKSISSRFPFVTVEKYVIMPNHIHLLLCIDYERQEQSPCPTSYQKSLTRQEQSPCPTFSKQQKSLGDIICAFKSITTKRVNKVSNKAARKIWQYRYHDHVVRKENNYLNIWNYIDTNIYKWKLDCYYKEDAYEKA